MIALPCPLSGEFHKLGFIGLADRRADRNPRLGGGGGPTAGADSARLLTARTASDSEEGRGLLQLLGLAAHFLGGSGQFLGRSGILLGGLAELGDGRVDLGHTGGLLL